MRLFVRTLVLLAALHAAVPSTKGQELPVVTVTSLSASGITFSAYNSATSPIFARFVEENPGVAWLAPYAAILTNSSNRSIMALTVLWRCVNPTAKPCGLTLRQDGLFLVQDAVLPPGSKLFVTPSYNWLESRVSQSYRAPMSESHLRSIAENYQKSSAVFVEVDAIVFDDGTVIGPDRSRTVENIKARKQAAETISQMITPILESGGDPTGALAEFTRLGDSLGEPLGVWYQKIARMFSGQPLARQKVLAEELSNLPDVNRLR